MIGSFVCGGILGVIVSLFSLVKREPKETFERKYRVMSSSQKLGILLLEPDGVHHTFLGRSAVLCGGYMYHRMKKLIPSGSASLVLAQKSLSDEPDKYSVASMNLSSLILWVPLT